jgi:hypothetical protein
VPVFDLVPKLLLQKAVKDLLDLEINYKAVMLYNRVPLPKKLQVEAAL